MVRPQKAILWVGVAVAAFLVSAVAGQSVSEIFVDASAAPGGNGTSGAAYRTIREAVADANARIDDAIIHIAEGNYVEAPDIRITHEGVRLIGSTTLDLDASGLPTGGYQHAAIIRPDVAPNTLVPVGKALFQENASRVEIAGLVLDGGMPRPALSTTGGVLVMVDGAPTARQLSDISIHDNVVINTGLSVVLRLTSVAVTRNFFARSNIGLVAFAGFDVGQPQVSNRLVFTGNRFVEHQNIALNVVGSVGSLFPPSFATYGLVAGPSVTYVTIAGNDFVRNSNGPAYPQPIQYSALNFNPMSNTSGDPVQPTWIYADVQDNQFAENGYGVSVSQRVATTQNQTAYTFEGRLARNTYCGNGLNDAFFNFNLNSQSHGLVGAGGQFRYATNSTYVIDATGDGLTAAGFDSDHPTLDPRLPLSSPGTLALANLLVFNGASVPNGVRLMRPPLLSPGPPAVFGPIDVGLTPTLSLVGPDPMIVDRDAAFVDPGTTAIDPCEGDLSAKVVTTGTVDTATPGTYVIRYAVTNAVGKQAPAVERTVTVLATKPVAIDLFLDGTGPLTASSSLLLSGIAPAAAAVRSQDSTGIKFAGGNPWKVVGTWAAAAAVTGGGLEAVRPVRAWLGLENSDDQGTRFDVRAEVLRNGGVVAAGETRCVQGVTRNANQALEAVVAFGSFAPVTFDGSQDLLSLRISTRIGTTAAGAICGGHSNATGLRLYFASASRRSGLGLVLRR